MKSDDVIIRNLKARFFDLARKEDFGNTPDITKELDNLQEAIRSLEAGSVCGS